jgi:hypothetical protein
MPALVVPGVRVEARFDVLPPLPAPSGIVGVAGIVDRPPPGGALVSVTKPSELRELLGPGTQASMPEAIDALANGAVELVVASVDGGAPGAFELVNDDNNPAVRLVARSNGAWVNDLKLNVHDTRGPDGKLMRVGLQFLLGGSVVESFSDLQTNPGGPDDLFDVLNEQSRYVVAIDPGFADAAPAPTTGAFSDTVDEVDVLRASSTDVLFKLTPAPGATPTGLSFELKVAAGKIELQVFQAGLQERFTNLVMNPDKQEHLPYVLATQSRLLRVVRAGSRTGPASLPKQTIGPVGPTTAGTSPTTTQFQTAIDRFSDDPRIDLVIAAVEPATNRTDVMTIHGMLGAHAVAMADAGAPRIAFGSVTKGEQANLDDIKGHAASVRNRRFVLVSPPGAAGAVAGVVGRMNPQDSVTFKTVPLFALPPARYRESELNRLLGPSTNLLVVQDRAGHGVIALKGIDTTGDQISVTRVADAAIRETKASAENFIGQLNTDDARVALRQQIIATFTRMTREGALVPSTDGTDPPFLVDVYSTQQDFAQGIVRIDIAVRPVRAIDYVYATIRVKN